MNVTKYSDENFQEGNDLVQTSFAQFTYENHRLERACGGELSFDHVNSRDLKLEGNCVLEWSRAEWSRAALLSVRIEK